MNLDSVRSCDEMGMSFKRYFSSGVCCNKRIRHKGMILFSWMSNKHMCIA